MSDKASLRRLLYEHAKAERTEKVLQIEDQILDLFDAVRDEACVHGQEARCSLLDAAEARAKKLNDRFIVLRDFLKQEIIINPVDSWQWGYRAAILAVADRLLFEQDKH